MISIEDVREAARNIGGRVRRTPVIVGRQPQDTSGRGWGGYPQARVAAGHGLPQARGATNKLMATDPEVLEKGIVAASGGNHG